VPHSLFHTACISSMQLDSVNFLELFLNLNCHVKCTQTGEYDAFIESARQMWISSSLARASRTKRSTSSSPFSSRKDFLRLYE
jgi:hypothetical protein